MPDSILNNPCLKAHVQSHKDTNKPRANFESTAQRKQICRVSDFASERRGRTGARQNMFDIGPVPSPSYSVFSAASPAAWQSELSSGTQTLNPEVLSPPFPPPSSQSQSSVPAAQSQGGWRVSTRSPAAFQTLGSASSLDRSAPVTSSGGFLHPAPSAASTAVSGGSAPKRVSGSVSSQPSTEAAGSKSSSERADPKPSTRSRARKSSVDRAAPESSDGSCIAESSTECRTAAAPTAEALSDAGRAADAAGKKPRGGRTPSKTKGPQQPKRTKAAKKQSQSRKSDAAPACSATPDPCDPHHSRTAEESVDAAAGAQKSADHLETEAAVRVLVGLNLPDGLQVDRELPCDVSHGEKACSERSRDIDEMIVAQERLTDDDTRDCAETVGSSSCRGEGRGRGESPANQTSYMGELARVSLPETAPCQPPTVEQRSTSRAVVPNNSSLAESELPDLTPVPFAGQPPAALSSPRAWRKRKTRSSHTKTPGKRARREQSPAAEQTLSQDTASTSFKSPVRKHKGGTKVRKENSSQKQSQCLSMPFLGDVSISPTKPRLAQENQPRPETFSVVRIEDGASAPTVHVVEGRDMPMGASSPVSGQSIINRYSSLLDQLESEGQGDPTGNVTAVSTPATILSNVQTNYLQCAPAESRNQAVEEPASPHQTTPGSGESNMHPESVPPVSRRPVPSVQNMQVVLLSQSNPQKLGFVFSPPPPTQSHRQLFKDLDKEKRVSKGSTRKTELATEPRSDSGPDRTCKRGRPRRKTPNTIHLIPQELFLGANRCRPLLPKTLQPEACDGGNNVFVVADSHAPSSSDRTPSSLATNPLDAAVQIVLPEFATQGFSGSESKQSCGMAMDQAAGVTTSLHSDTSVQGASAVAKAQPKKGGSSKRKERIKTAATGAAGAQPAGAKRKRKKKTEESFAADYLPDLASPQPLVIDDRILVSGAETPPSMTRAERKCTRRSDHGKVEIRTDSQEGRNAKGSRRKPKDTLQHNPASISAIQLSAMPASSDDEHLQSSVHGTLSSDQQPPATTAQELFKLMMNPPVPSAVPVTESECNVSLSDHDALTALVPASMLPSVSSPSDAGSFMTPPNHPASHFQFSASGFDATPEQTALQAPVTDHSGQGKSLVASTSRFCEDDAPFCAAAQRDGHGSSATADFSQPAPAKRTARGLASGKRHPGSVSNVAAAVVQPYPPALPTAQVSSQSGRSHVDRSALVGCSASDSPRAVQAAETLASLAAMGAARQAAEPGIGNSPAKGGIDASRSSNKQSAVSGLLHRFCDLR